MVVGVAAEKRHTPMRASWSYYCFPCGYRRTVARVPRAYVCASTTGLQALLLSLNPDCPDTLGRDQVIPQPSPARIPLAGRAEA